MKILFRESIFISLIISVCQLPVTGQIKTSDPDGRLNTINTYVPFLRITPDARSGAMGEVGLSTSPDANSIFWNPAKLAFIENDIGFSVSYTPWLRQLASNWYLNNLSGYKKIGQKQVLGVSMTYFHLGEIVYTNPNGAQVGTFNPEELSVDLIYSRKISDNFSAGLSLKYFSSHIYVGSNGNGIPFHAGQSLAAGISAYYNKDISIMNLPEHLSFGVNISNIGPKISYTNEREKDFIPANLGVGTAVDIQFSKKNKLTLAVDINKLLVPTPDLPDSSMGWRLDIHAAKGIFTSFYDAPGGFMEELHELMFSFGMEYRYTDRLAIRTGYFYEHATKGNRKYLTTGIGLRIWKLKWDVSYIIPSHSQPNVLDNTIHFTLSLDFEDLKKKCDKPDN